MSPRTLAHADLLVTDANFTCRREVDGDKGIRGRIPYIGVEGVYVVQAHFVRLANYSISIDIRDPKESGLLTFAASPS